MINFNSEMLWIKSPLAEVAVLIRKQVLLVIRPHRLHQLETRQSDTSTQSLRSGTLITLTLNRRG